jgi:uncharacterized membrane protein
MRANHDEPTTVNTDIRLKGGAMNRRDNLAVPRQRRRLGPHYDNDAFGQFAESIARTLGTARFLVWQSFIIIFWIFYNVVLPESWRFDPWGRGLVLLTLVLSLQASYAAPLILLAQNRQEARDQAQAEVDRRVAERTQADTEFLAREIASVRVSLTDVATTQDIRDLLDVEELNERIERLTAAIEALSDRMDRIEDRSTT